MGRAIITAPSGPVVRSGFPEPIEEPGRASHVSVQQEKPDTYRERLFKYIPAEVVTLYLGLNTVVASNQDAPKFLYWVIFFAGLLLTPFYLRRLQNVTAPVQLIISTIAFAVWVFAIGGPFAHIEGYKQVYGAVLLPIFTFFIAIIAPPQQSGQQASDRGGARDAQHRANAGPGAEAKERAQERRDKT